MTTQIICGIVLGIGTSMCGYSVVDFNNPDKLVIAWAWILIGNLIMAVLAEKFNLP